TRIRALRWDPAQLSVVPALPHELSHQRQYVRRMALTIETWRIPVNQEIDVVIAKHPRHLQLGNENGDIRIGRRASSEFLHDLQAGQRVQFHRVKSTG